MSKLDQLYTGFVNMPTEYQVVASVGCLVLLAAVKNVWGMLYPVRLAAASLLRSVAYVLHPRKKTQKTQRVQKGSTTVQVERDTPPPFDVSSKGNFIITMRYYANKDTVNQLSTEQVGLLFDTASVYSYNTYTSDYCKIDKLMIPLAKEKRVRNEVCQVKEKAKKAAQLQEEAKVPFYASEDDVI